jgi:hypothetical protein
MATCLLERLPSAPAFRPISINGAGQAVSIQGVEPRQHQGGTASSFEEARAGFEEAWFAVDAANLTDFLNVKRKRR